MSSRYPFSSYPRSWYRIDLSKNVRIGKVNRYQYFGKSLICTRGADGEIILREDQESNESTPTRRFPTQELNKNVFAYYSEDRSEPTFRLSEIPEFKDPSWSSVRTLNYKGVSHVQEFVENAVDTGHFISVHKMPDLPQIEKFELMGSTFSFRSVGFRKVMHFRTHMDIRVQPMGLAVIAGWTLTKLLEVRNIHCVTPIDERNVVVSVSYVFKKNWNPLRTLILHLALNKALYNFTSPDLPIFAEKKYVQKPLLCGRDGPIVRVRNWAQQFY